MGTYSFYLTSRNNATGCKIDWKSMDTKKLFQSYTLKNCYMKMDNLEEVAKELNETKLFGYHTESLMEALDEFTRHLIPYDCFPRVYYEYEGGDYLICYEFIPGSHFNVLLFDYNEYHYDILDTLPELKGWYMA